MPAPGPRIPFCPGCGSVASAGYVVRKRHKDSASYNVAKCYEQHVERKAAQRHGVMRRLQKRHGEERHVRDAVFESCCDESEEAPEDHDQLASVGCRASGAPDRKAHKVVAENAAREELHSARPHLGRSRRHHEVRHLPRAEACQVVDAAEDDSACEVADPAYAPELQSAAPADLFVQDAGRHREVVAREELGSRHNDQAQRDAEREAHHDLRIRLTREKSARREREEHADADIRSRHHRHDEVAERIFIQESNLHSRSV